MKIFEFDREREDVDPEALHFYQANGFALFANVLSMSEIAATREKVEYLAKKELADGAAHVYGENLQRVWNLVNKDSYFQEMITMPQILAWANKIFDRNTNHLKFYLSSFQANILKPGAEPQILHIDTPVPDPLPVWEMKFNTIWPLDDFTEENGATQVIAGSHNFGRRPIDSDPNDHRGLQSVVVPAGSLLLTSGCLWHRSGRNKTNRARRALLGSFAASFFREISSEEDIVRYQLSRAKTSLDTKCWEIVGGQHGVKPGS